MFHKEKENTTVEEVSKSQFIRLLDVFFIARFKTETSRFLNPSFINSCSNSFTLDVFRVKPFVS